MEMTQTRIAIVDDHELFREGLKRIFDLEDEFKVVAEGRTGREAIRIAGEQKPEILIMDINMPDMNGIEATKQLSLLSPETRVLILSIHDDESYITHALEAGASKRSRIDRIDLGSPCRRKGWGVSSSESDNERTEGLPPSLTIQRGTGGTWRREPYR